jgi:hypothetical protein
MLFPTAQLFESKLCTISHFTDCYQLYKSIEASFHYTELPYYVVTAEGSGLLAQCGMYCFTSCAQLATILIFRFTDLTECNYYCVEHFILHNSSFLTSSSHVHNQCEYDSNVNHLASLRRNYYRNNQLSKTEFSWDIMRHINKSVYTRKLKVW